MSPDEYLAQRIDDQIGWYDRKSVTAQLVFKSLRVAEILCASAIPLIAGFSIFDTHTSLALGILGLLIAVFASLIGLGNYQENWVEYRTTCESLRHEKYLFLTKATPYDQVEAFNLLVQRVEGLISKQNSAWSQTIRTAQRTGTSQTTPH